MTSRASIIVAAGLLLTLHLASFGGIPPGGTTAVSLTRIAPLARAAPPAHGAQGSASDPRGARASRLGAFSLPAGVGPVDVVHAFDRPPRDWIPGHRGVDIRAEAGSTIRAPSSGVVTFSGSVAGRGVLVVTHRLGLRSSFEPIADAVPVGTSVVARGRLGVLANTAGHCDPSSCLHWGVRLGEEYLDPMSLIVPAHAVLLPWDWP